MRQDCLRPKRDDGSFASGTSTGSAEVAGCRHCHGVLIFAEEMSKEHPDAAVVHKWILTFVFYWFAFMPLARGTALCGNLAMHAMLLASGYRVCFGLVTESIDGREKGLAGTKIVTSLSLQCTLRSYRFRPRPGYRLTGRRSCGLTRTTLWPASITGCLRS